MKKRPMFKKALAIICAVAMLFAALPIVSVFAEQTTPYVVKAESPAIPMNAGTYVNLADLAIEYKGANVAATEFDFAFKTASDSVFISNGKLYALDATEGAANVYPVTATNKSDGGKVNLFVVVKQSTESEWLIYDEAFENNTTTMPAGWSVQMYNTRSWTANYYSNTMNASQQTASINKYEFATFTTPGKGEGNTFVPYDNTGYTASEMAFNSSYQGFIPFQSLWSGNFRANPSFFTLNNDVVKAFSDYTVNVEMLAGSGHYQSAEEGNIYFGVGAFGRAQLNANGMLYNKGTVSSIIYNRAYRVTALQTVDFEAEQANAVKRTKFTDEGWDGANWYNSGEQNVSLKYSGNTITLNGSDVYTASDIAVAKGGVGVVVYGVTSGGDYGAKTNNKQACAKIQHFSVALNNAADECPVAYPSDIVIYAVSQSSPAIPMNELTAVKLSDLKFELTDGVFTNGANVTVTLANATENVVIKDGTITAYETGTYKVNVTDNTNSMVAFVVVKKSTDSEWYLYNNAFTGTNDDLTGWNTQGYSYRNADPQIYFKDYWVDGLQTITHCEFFDFPAGSLNDAQIRNYEGQTTYGYRKTSDVLGYVPFKLCSTYDWTTVHGLFTIKIDALSSFSDYTVDAKVETASAAAYTVSGNSLSSIGTASYGVGLLGRITGNADGKLTKADTKTLPTMLVNPADGQVVVSNMDVSRVSLDWNDMVNSSKATAYDVAKPWAYASAGAVNTLKVMSISNKYEGNTVTMYSDEDTDKAVYTTANTGTGNIVGIDLAAAATNRAYNNSFYGGTVKVINFGVKLNNKANECPLAVAVKDPAYYVTQASPAIPMNKDTVVDISKLKFELTAGNFVGGNDVTVTLAQANKNIIIENGTITVYATGTYKVNVTDNTNSMVAYIVVKNAEDDAWYIYNETFGSEWANVKSYPAGWSTQLYNMYTWDNPVTSIPGNDVISDATTPKMPIQDFVDLNTIGTGGYGYLSAECNNWGKKEQLAFTKTTGIVPVALLSTNSWQYPAFFTLNNDVVKDFADFTIVADMETITNGIKAWGYMNIFDSAHPENQFKEIPDNASEQYGVGLFGRVQLSSAGKLTKADTMAINSIVVDNTHGTVAMNTVDFVNTASNYGMSKSVINGANAQSDNVTAWASATSDAASSHIYHAKFEGTKLELSDELDSTGTVYTATVAAGKGGVGVSIFGIGAQQNGHGMHNSTANIQSFKVALNNAADECPEATPAPAQSYKVTQNSPAIPMNFATQVEFGAMSFELTAGEFTNGEDVTITLANNADAEFVIIDNAAQTIAVKNTGAFKVTVSDGNNSMAAYVVVKKATDTAWYLYNQAFANDGNDLTGWYAQGFIADRNASSTGAHLTVDLGWDDDWKDKRVLDPLTFFDMEQDSRSDVTVVINKGAGGRGRRPAPNIDGIVPFKIGYSNAFAQTAAYYTKQIDILNDFSDYTVASYIEASTGVSYNGSFDYYSTYGVGLLGRLTSDTNGKLSKSATVNVPTMVVNTADGQVVKSNFNVGVDDSQQIKYDPLPGIRNCEAYDLSNPWAYASAGAVHTMKQLNLAVKYEGNTATMYSPDDDNAQTYVMQSTQRGSTVGVTLYAPWSGANYSNNNQYAGSLILNKFAVQLNNAPDNCPEATEFLFDVTDVYVSAFGSDTNGGLSASAPFKTLAAAYNRLDLAEGGTIHVLDAFNGTTSDVTEAKVYNYPNFKNKNIVTYTNIPAHTGVITIKGDVEDAIIGLGASSPVLAGPTVIDGISIADTWTGWGVLYTGGYDFTVTGSHKFYRVTGSGSTFNFDPAYYNRLCVMAFSPTAGGTVDSSTVTLDGNFLIGKVSFCCKAGNYTVNNAAIIIDGGADVSQIGMAADAAVTTTLGTFTVDIRNGHLGKYTHYIDNAGTNGTTNIGAFYRINANGVTGTSGDTFAKDGVISNEYFITYHESVPAGTLVPTTTPGTLTVVGDIDVVTADELGKPVASSAGQLVLPASGGYSVYAAENYVEDAHNDGNEVVVVKDSDVVIAALDHNAPVGQAFLGWQDEEGNYITDAVYAAKAGEKLTAVYAEVDTSVGGDFYVAGAQIRTTGVEGLRFIIEKKMTANDVIGAAADAEFGALILPTSYTYGKEMLEGVKNSIGTGDATVTSKYAPSVVKGTNIFRKLQYGNVDSVEYTVVVTNIAAAKYDRSYTVRGYIRYTDRNGNAQVLYSDSYQTSLYKVAMVALADTSTAYEPDAIGRFSAIQQYVETTRVSDMLDGYAIAAEDRDTYNSANENGSDVNVYKLNNGLRVREVNIAWDYDDGDYSDNPNSIIQLSDLHFNYCNDEDMAEANPAIMSTLANRTWLANGKSAANAIKAMEYATLFDKIVITGDITDYLSNGCFEMSKNLAFDANVLVGMKKATADLALEQLGLDSKYNSQTSVIATLGNHETFRQMQGKVSDPTSAEENLAFVQERWPNNATYYSEITTNADGKNPVMIIAMDNGTATYNTLTNAQIAEFKADLAYANTNNIPVLIFQHEAIWSNGGESGAVNSASSWADGGFGATLNVATAGVGKDANIAAPATKTDEVYAAIVNNASIIKGIFCGHQHGDFYTKVLGSDGSTVIPQYALTSIAYGDGTVLQINVGKN